MRNEYWDGKKVYIIARDRLTITGVVTGINDDVIELSNTVIRFLKDDGRWVEGEDKSVSRSKSPVVVQRSQIITMMLSSAC